MALFSIPDIAAFYGAADSTTSLHIKRLKDGKKFKKSSLGAKYNEADVAKLSQLMGFKWPLTEAEIKKLTQPTIKK